ncbi:endonuclease/exonuclease/phosphatase family protein [Streptomyces sp. WZ-12]|uniref:endonuclease/exonuclease/phosphatase family protein n=1 Tax=Streptomyces sp. WZ-12 TaxID=3030210 RepID=UPI0023812040|nr:endonuclease/exonuclease/phosphatase family protein [Streptomyces sp. WZ-12]
MNGGSGGTDTDREVTVGSEGETGNAKAAGSDEVPSHDNTPARWSWRSGRATATLAVLCAAVLLLHQWIPNGPGRLPSLIESFLPWLGVAVLPLLAVALVRRSATALVAVLVPAVTWACLFGGTLVDKRGTGGALTVVSHNVDDENPDPAGTGRALAASGADVIGLEKLTDTNVPRYERALAAAYPYHQVQGTVGLWSKLPLRDVRPVPIMAWTRAMRATVETPKGPVAIFVAHLPSVRVRPTEGFATNWRDHAVVRLADEVRRTPERRRIVMGDFNGTADDRGLAPLTSMMRSAQQEAGAGFGFTWPAALPVVRIDQVFTQGVEPVAAWTLPRTASDHRPVAASVNLSPAPKT